MPAAEHAPLDHSSAGVWGLYLQVLDRPLEAALGAVVSGTLDLDVMSATVGVDRGAYRLRTKLGRVFAEHLETVRHVGYRLSPASRSLLNDVGRPLP